MRERLSPIFIASITGVFFLLCFLLYTSLSARKTADFPQLEVGQDSLIIGPEKLCILFGSVIGDFIGVGEAGDVYRWELVNQSGDILFSRDLGTPEFSYTFATSGQYELRLELRRGNTVIGTETRQVEILPSPEINLDGFYIICPGQNLTLSAINPGSEDFEDYIFEWKDSNGNVISNSNEDQISKPDTYSVEFYFENSLGDNECLRTLSTTVLDLTSFSITSNKSELCTTQFIEFRSNPNVIGNWYFMREGESTRTFLGTASSFSLSPARDLPGTGEFQMIFELPNSNNSSCTTELTRDFTHNPEPRIVLEEAFGASDCKLNDGILRIRTLTDVDRITIDSLGISQGPFIAGQIVDFPGLKSGAYTLSTSLGSCFYSIGTVVPLDNPIPELEFEIVEIIPETCTETGKNLGGFTFLLKNGATLAGYEILSERGVPVILQDTTELADTVRIDLPGGKYFFEIFNGDECAQPKSEVIEIPGLSQVSFSVPNTINICQSFDLYPSTSQPLEFLLTDPDGIETTFEAGNFGTITKEGTYTIVGRLPNQDKICPFLREFTVNLVDPIEFEPRLIEEDCFGNRIFEADIFGVDPSTARFTWYDENDIVVSRGQFLIPIAAGEYKLDVQPANAQACPIPPKTFLIEEPVLEVDISFTQTKLCEFGPEAIITMESTFPDAVTTIRWRRFNEDGSVEELADLTGSNEFQTRIPGTYEASLYRFIPGISVEECELGRATLELEFTNDRVTFEIPGELTVCERFELVPDTDQQLDFFITSPSGAVNQIATGESILIDQIGIYTFLAFDQNNPTSSCPEQKELNVTLVEKVEFAPILVERFCDGSYTYQADLGNYLPDEVIFAWTDESGSIIGEKQDINIPEGGTYALIVQPKGATPCEYDAIPFEIPNQLISLDVELLSGPLCPDAESANLSILNDPSLFFTTRWLFTDLEGNARELVDQEGKTEIEAKEEGIYEVRVFNDIACELGTAETLILRSQDIVRPQTNSQYGICPRLEVGPEIDPGNFLAYEWYYDSVLVATDPTIVPKELGIYELIVTSLEGCSYSTTFETIEVCEPEVMFPTAVNPADSDKLFYVYPNYLVDEISIFIFNQWGELIYQCKDNDINDSKSQCVWDGTIQGKKIPNGSYSVRFDLVNYDKNIQRSQFGSITVID